MSNNFECDNSSWGFENNSVSDREQCLRNKNVDSSVFGSYNNTYDWVECESTSFPGTVYYFNLRTLCTTWTRPVSRHVPLQRFQRNQKKFDDSFTCDSHDTSMVVSSDSDHEYANSEDSTKHRENKKKCKMSDTLGHLYYGVDVHNFIDSACESVIHSSSEDPYNDEDFCLTFSDDSFNQIGKHFLTYHVPNRHQVNQASRENTDESLESSKEAADFLEVEVCTAVNMETREQSSEDDVSFIEKQRIAYSTSSSHEAEVDENYNYFVPHLSKIKAKHLLKDGPVKKRKRRNVKRRAPVMKKNLKPTKIVCEMYGTKTINYNPIEVKELPKPPPVKQSTLSDSSVTSSHQEETCKSVAWDKFEFLGTNIRVNNLSSSSSSSDFSLNSCSCYTCSMSSGTIESSSSTDTWL